MPIIYFFCARQERDQRTELVWWWMVWEFFFISGVTRFQDTFYWNTNVAFRELGLLAKYVKCLNWYPNWSWTGVCFIVVQSSPLCQLCTPIIYRTAKRGSIILGGHRAIRTEIKVDHCDIVHWFDQTRIKHGIYFIHIRHC